MKKFLNHWLVPILISIIYWFWNITWRFRLDKHPDAAKALRDGQVSFAHWHGDEGVLVRLGRTLNGATMASTSKDGEILTRILKIFGFEVARGSSTRGGVRGLVQLVRLVRDGKRNGTLAVDGPKGPRHKVKPGILILSKQTDTPILPVAVAAQSSLVFKRSWDKTYLPWPFTKVIVRLGEPFYVRLDENGALGEEQLKLEQDRLEEIIHLERGRAQALLLGRR